MRIACFGDSLTSGVPGSSYFGILRQHFPEETLLNYGKGNDTVVSLLRRLSAAHVDKPLDIAFLWIGVNDVLVKDGWLPRTYNRLIGQRRARDLEEFGACFLATLDHLCDWSRAVIVAPPLLKGENLDTRWNGILADLAQLTKELTAECEQAIFLDLRAVFIQELDDKSVSDYLLPNPLIVLSDAVTLRTDAQVDAKSAERGLHLTLDGLHLNSAGARLVARELGEAIRNLRS